MTRDEALLRRALEGLLHRLSCPHSREIEQGGYYVTLKFITTDIEKVIDAGKWALSGYTRAQADLDVAKHQQRESVRKVEQAQEAVDRAEAELVALMAPQA